MTTKELERFALEIRLKTVECIKSRGFGHIGGSLSVCDVLAVLYGDIMNYDPKDPKKADRDKFVSSKGHAGPAVYATLALKGFFPEEELMTLNQPGTNLPSHCDMNKTPGIDMTTGSLGQGTSEAVGLALGDKLLGRDCRTYLLVGDGEANEGQVWEAAMFAAANKLSRLVAIVDNNGLQIDGRNAEVCDLGDISAKFRAFGWDAREVDGHDVEALYEALSSAREHAGGPSVVIAHTVKGKGVSFMEDQVGWHGKAPNAEQAAQALAELSDEGGVR